MQTETFSSRTAHRSRRPGRGWFAAATALVALTALAACSSSDSEGATTTTEASSSTTTAQDGGDIVTEPGPVSLGVGDRATLELEANPTTGYQWELATEPDAAVVSVVSDTYTASTTDSGMVGAGGTQRIVIQGVAAGSTTLELRYVRPWETDGAAAQTASFDITVE
jgi:inhibitor of cysteine peptidase